MSGGHFDYNQFRIDDIADAIDELIAGNKTKNCFDECRNFSDDTLEYFKDASCILRIASIYTNNIDLLVCGDTGEETFEVRLNEALEELCKSFQDHIRQI